MKFVKENGNEEEKSKVFFLADNDEEMRRFIKYIGEYYTCFDKIDDEMQIVGINGHLCHIRRTV